MISTSFTISGKIIDKKTKKGIPGLQVEVWDRDLFTDDYIESIETDAQGAFRMEIARGTLRDIVRESRPDIYFKIYKNNKLIKSTENAILRNVLTSIRDISIEIENIEEAGIELLFVEGTIVRPDGRPLEGLTVKAFDKSLRNETLLGEAVTGGDGTYSISYTHDRLSSPDKTGADLVVRASDRQGQEIAFSQTIIAAPPQVEVDLVQGNQPLRGPSEYTRVHDAVTPLLGDVEPAEINAADVYYLADKTGLHAVNIAYYGRSAQFEKLTGIPGENFYGLFRQGMPTTLNGILRQGPKVQRQALKTAAHKNIVPMEVEDSLDDTIKGLRGQIVERSFITPDEPGVVSLGDVLNTTGLPQEQQRDFLDRYVHHEGTVEDFWQGLRDDPSFGEESVGKLQSTLQLNTLALNHLPMLKELQGQQAAGEFSTLQELAKRGQAEWEKLIREGIGVPSTIPGKDEDTKIENYALTITWMLEDAFPTTALAAGLTGEYGTTLDQFLEQDKTFEFRDIRIHQYLEINPGALEGFEDPDNTVEQLKSIQRLFNITPVHGKAEAMIPLLEDGLDSAHAIRQLGKPTFVETYAEQLGEEGAKGVYEQASQVTAISLNLFTQNAAPFTQPGLYVTADNTAAAIANFPDFESLFGSLDLCACEHCESVYSPAAYLVDMLHFLEKRETNDKSALEVLFQRRGDIGEIELTCENTNTMLPYVDLVCEILENYVMQSSEVYQTEGRAEILRVQPEHLNPGAYDLLAGSGAVHPWGLPFDLWAAEARTYLAHLGVRRDKLMERFSREDQEPLPRDVSVEYLGLTPLEREIITGTSTGSLEDYWGIPGADPVTELTNVSRFLEQSQLSFEELQELLAVPYINPDPDPANHIYIEYSDAACDLDAANLTNLTAGVLKRTHRLVRLQRKLGWRIYELGAALQVLPPHDLKDALLKRLANIMRMRGIVDVPLMEMLAWWGNISTTAYDHEPSLYESLFLDRTVMDEEDPVFGIFQLNAGGDELAGAGALMDDYASTVVAALGISEEELDDLIEAELSDGPDNTLTLSNLSALYRAVSLSRALDLSISQYLSLRELSGIDPFQADALNASRHFIESVERISAAGFTIPGLDYLLRHIDTGGIAPTDDVIALFLEDLRAGLDKIAADNSRTNDPARVQTGQLPVTLQESKDLLTAMIKQKVSGAFELEMETAELLLDELVPSLDPNSKGKTAIADFLALVSINSDDDENSEPEITMTADNFPVQFHQYLRFHKIAMVLDRFDIPTADVEYYFLNADRMGWLNLNQLPLSESAVYETTLSDAWWFTDETVRLRDGLPAGEPGLFELLDMLQTGVTLEEFRASLIQRTGWPEADVEFLMGSRGFDLTFPGDFLDELAIQQLSRLSHCFEMIDLIGMSAQQVWSWNTPAVVYEQARSIKQAARAKYDETQWLEVAQPLRDDLREKQRAALTDYVIYQMADADITDTNDLFGHFLIDAEMTSCMQTSRIKQALSSVQLFVQRCLMGLETEVSLGREDAQEWAWMKNYRVWEANRKIFLYPENWIEPELRDDKSPFFTDLENELLQNDVTLDTAEKAFLNYLEKLDAVSRLEISGMYRQQEENTDIVHVIGRTRNTPHIYYYRQWVDSAAWTPWERIDLDIEGDHLMPVIYNRRLYLFWALIKEKDEFLWQVQMAWSEYKNGKWSAKKVSDDSFDYYYSYFSPTTTIFRTSKNGDLVIKFITNITTGYTEMYRFKFIGCDGSIQLLYESKSCEIALPNGTEVEAMKFKEEEGDHPFQLAATTDPGADQWVPMLDETPGTFKVAYSHQYKNFSAGAPFFYEDDTRTFFVMPQDESAYKENYDIPSEENNGTGGWHNDSITPGVMDSTQNHYFDQIELHDLNTGIPDQIGPGPGDGNYGGGRSRRLDTNMDTNTDARGYSKADLAWEGGFIEEILGEWEPHQESTYYGTLSLVNKKCRFLTFYHPYVCLLIKQLNRYGIDGMLNPEPDPGGEAEDLRRQFIEEVYFVGEYEPTDNVIEPYPQDDIDFSSSGSYALYNWELFFHAPFLIANHLSKNQRFEEAQQWYHYIFDPTDTDIPDPTASESDTAHFWKIKPLYEYTEGKPIQELMMLLEPESDLTTPTPGSEREELEKQIAQWRADPFNPHVIARLRYSAYQKAIVMKYIDNLIAWGDHLFRQDTIESINEATQLYILAAQILGDRPESIPPPEDVVKKINGVEVKTFNDLQGHLDAFSNALVEIETQMVSGGTITGTEESSTPSVLGPSLFFCIPENDVLLGYWDTVADRLFKIRHCMNIEGVVRELPLFQPPIPPGLLVQAAAAGVDIGSALNDLYAPLPHYRFRVMLQKAVEFCSDVRSLGTALLSALEKKDAEELALLRSSHEIQLLESLRQVKKEQLNEARETRNTLDHALAMAERRHDYYKNLKYMNAGEIAQLSLMGAAAVWDGVAQVLSTAASAAEQIPDMEAGTTTTGPTASAELPVSGEKVGSGLEKAAAAMRIMASLSNLGAQMSGIMAGYQRRSDEWKLQEDLAKEEINQIGKQITAADIRVTIAEKEVENNDRQIENARSVETFMKDKFTNRELYSWMISQISSIYFQSYQMAYDLAKKAEKAFRHEIGDDEATFIQFGYWDSLKKGLLSGEKLHYDLKRMEAAYLDQNKREYEITRHISLAMLDPISLVMLKETGECFVNLPEEIFDLDFPGHYMRRIKSVSLTIPCVSGPYTSVNCTLTLLGNRIRKNTGISGGYAYTGLEDTRFQHNTGATQSVATSTGQGDSGMFELNFRDDRYLPFEGAGVISEWRLELPKEFRQFDYHTISDVVFHIKYTARDGGETLKSEVNNELKESILAMAMGSGNTGLTRMLSAAHDFSNGWYRFLHPGEGQVGQNMTLDISAEKFPYMFRDYTIEIQKVEMLLLLEDEYLDQSPTLTIGLTPPAGSINNLSLEVNPDIGGQLYDVLPLTASPGEWLIQLNEDAIPPALQEDNGDHVRLNSGAVKDLVLILHYNI